MNKPIIYSGVEYKDKFTAYTKIKPTLMMRLRFLLCTSFTFEHESYLKEEMPENTTICHLYIGSIRDLLRGLFTKKQGMMEAPKNGK